MPRVARSGGSPRNNYETPLAEFTKWHHQYRFTVDAAASHDNALLRPHREGCRAERNGFFNPATDLWCGDCKCYIGKYYTIDDDALVQSFAGERVFLNPPYRPPGSSLYHWVEKAFESSRDEGAFWLMLLPPSTDTEWYHDFVWDEELHRPRHRAEIFTPQGRIKFRDPANPEKVAPPTGNLFVAFHPWVYPKGHQR